MYINVVQYHLNLWKFYVSHPTIHIVLTLLQIPIGLNVEIQSSLFPTEFECRNKHPRRSRVGIASCHVFSIVSKISVGDEMLKVWNKVIGKILEMGLMLFDFLFIWYAGFLKNLFTVFMKHWPWKEDSFTKLVNLAQTFYKGPLNNYKNRILLTFDKPPTPGPS